MVLKTLKIPPKTSEATRKGRFAQMQNYLSLRKHPFLLALRRWGRFVLSGEERGETDVFAG